MWSMRSAIRASLRQSSRGGAKRWRAAFAGQPSHPVMKALMPHAAEYGIESRHLHAVIEGCQMDLEQTRYLDFAGLARYCHLVAGVVGEVASGIFGRSDPRTVQYAHKLGLAMQLTNIIRDVGDDARRGRIYLPVSELQRFEVKAQEMLNRGLQRSLHGADALSGRAGATHLRRGIGAAARSGPVLADDRG